MERRQLPGMSPASSHSSLAGTDSPLPSSPRGSVSGRAGAEGRGQGIQMQIQNLAHEQERVQKKTFTNWMNTYLCQKTPPIKVIDLFEEIKDGVVLLSLLEVLSGEKLPMEKGPKLKRPHHLSNISTALKFLEQKKIKLVNINTTDIADGKPAICLGLIWTIILYFQIEETISNVPDMEGEGPSSKKKPALPKQSLLAWAENVLTKKYGVQVKDFGKSWRDGIAFNAMIHNIRPDLVNLDEARLQTARINLERAFSTAENQLGIPRLLDPEDVDVEKPDEKSIMTYVAQFLKAYPDAGDPNFRGVPSTTMETADQEMQAYTSLLNWLNIDAPDILQNIDEPIEDRQAEFMEYLGFKTELDRREPVYKKIGERVTTGKALKVKPDEWEKLDKRWKEVVADGRRWLLKLDSSLPGRLGQFGTWLMQAEIMLEKEEGMLENPEEMASLLLQVLQEHREFFKDLEPNRVFFAQVKKSGRYEGEFLHAPHIEFLGKRMDAVCRLAPARQRRLEYKELRYRLLSFLVAAEQKLKSWSVKCGRQDNVEAMLADYQNFVVKGQLFENYDKLYAEIKKKEAAYKQDGADPAEVQAMDRYLEDVTARWKKVSVEIRSMQTMLKEVIENWSRFSACVDVLTVWITEGEKTMKKSPDEKQAFFQEIGPYEEKHKLLNESGNFLIEVTQEPIAAEIKQTLLMLNRRFTELLEGFQNFQQHEVIGRKRAEYAQGVGAIKKWLDAAQAENGREVPCIFAELKKHLEELDEMNNQIGHVENDFKTTTKTAQSLVKDSTQDVVNTMLQTLNVQKEVIVKLRKQIPERIKYIKAILSHVESLEVGVTELHEWLDRGDSLLKSHKLDSTGEQTEARLEAHKAFFSEFTYRKSILESKNKVYQKVVTTKDKLPNVNMTPLDELMRKINERFQNVTSDAREWEKELERMSKLWRTLQQKQTQLDSWLENAAGVLGEKEDNVESLIKKHKMFFDRADQRLLQEYLNVGAEILQSLDDRDKIALQSCMTDIQNRWKEVQRLAPLRLLKLEFAVVEDKFEANMETAEKALKQQQDQFARGENVKEALQKHRQLFHEGPFMAGCEKLLQEMNELSQQLLKQSKDDHSLQRRHKNHEDEFEKLRKMIDQIHLQLKQLPERWKDYNNRLGDLSGWMNGMETLLKELKRQDLTSEEYKEKLAKFQKELANKDKFAKDSKWLSDNLEELLKDAPNADAAKERERLKALLARFSGLSPGIEETQSKSGVLAKSFDYRDTVDKRRTWLDDAQKLVLEQPNIDSLEDARVYLQEHESIMVKLESEKANIQADLERGRRLKQEKGTPDFVLRSMEDLDRKWKDTNELAQAKHTKLKQVVQDWEKYEGEKSQLLQYLKKAEAELEKPPAVTGRELAEKDLQSKQELKGTLDKLKGSLAEVQRLNKLLAGGASRERQGPLKGEASDIDKRLESVSKRLNAKLADLEATIAKWNEYYKRLNNFCDWLNEKEAKLNEVYENKSDTPENQLKKAETISSEVYENHISLENLEKDAKGLSQNFRSRETAALKSKLMTVRRQWEGLCSRAKDRSTALSGNVQHWQRYQSLQEQLMPWIVKAEKYCATELPKCASLEEARDLYDLHQAFLQECEENLPVFEKMSTEAGYLMEQPDMARQLESIQKRWSNIFTSSEERSHQIDKMYGAWKAYCAELDNFQETMDKFHARLATEPNVSSTDVQVLEHELALAKALQEEIRSCQPQLNALQRQFGQVQPHASQEGMAVLKAKQEGVKAAWTEVNEAVAERQQVLSNAVQHRRDFYSRLGEVEKWVKKMQRKLDSGSEIYSDEVQETMNKLRALKRECSQQEPEFQALQQELKELMAGCSEDEAAVLADRFDKLLSGYTRMEDLLKNREDLCAKWSAYSQDHKDAQAKLKTLQARLQAPDIKEEEVALIHKEVDALRQGMKDWNKQSRALDDLMGDAQMVIKDRATQRTLHFGTELQSLDSLCDGVASSARQKEEHLGELSQLGEEFLARKDALLGKLANVEQSLNSAQVSASTLQGVKDLLAHVEDIRDDMYSNNPEYEQLRELGRQIMQSDTSQAGMVQTQLAAVNTAWENVQSLLGEKHQYLAGVLSQWQQYMDAKQAVARVLDDVEPNTQQAMAFTSPAEVKKALDQHKNAEFDLHANQTQLDHMNNKGLQLLQELRKVPNFDMQNLEQDLDKINHRWETANATIEEHRENLEAQLNCWDQVQTGREEVAAWISAMVQKLDDSIHNFDDAVTVESRLLKYKEECPYFAEVFKEVEQKIQDLQELNGGKDVPVLRQAQTEIKEQFARAGKLANQLEVVMSNFSDEQKDLQAAISEETDFINTIKDQLARCDDITGTDEEILERLQMAKNLQEQLASHQKKILAIKDKTTALQSKYPSAETASLCKDGGALMHKLDTYMNRAQRLQDAMATALEQNSQTAQQQQQRWLATAKEKVAWCGDIAGDRYSVEAKLSTVKEMQDAMAEGQQLKDVALAKLNTLKQILPRSRQAELESQRQAIERDWNALTTQIGQTQEKLGGSLDQWQAHDERYEKLNQWLKDTEARVRTEAVPKPDLATKQEQLQLFQGLEAEIQHNRPNFEGLRDSAQQISRSTGDNRTASYAGQLFNRYQTLATATREQLEQCEKNIADHESYMNKHHQFSQWLTSAMQQLEQCSDLAVDEDSLKMKVSIAQNLLASKEQGLALFNSVLEAGERLYPTTSNEGREGIRRELRALRDAWENFNDSLNESKRQLDSSAMQWSTFDENYEQLAKWVAEMDAQVSREPELKSTLQEKKAALQHDKTRCQDILSHQTMMDSISDKGMALSSGQVQNKLKQLNNKYNTLCNAVKAQVKKSEDCVEQHQSYVDAMQQCQDWMAATQDRITVCAEVAGDRQALQNRLERLEELMGTIRQGEQKVQAVHVLAQKTLPQTAPPGQANIRRDLDTLTSDWEGLVQRLDSTKQGLLQALKALETYDGTCEDLNRWLRDMENEVRSVELKPNQKEKQAQVEKFKAMHEAVVAKRDQFEELQMMAGQLQGTDTRLVHYTTQLGAKYEGLKSTIKDCINKWTDYAEEHAAYQTQLGQCRDWLEKLRRRLQVCSNLAGDRQDVEDKIAKLQELTVEKEEGANSIHHTADSGEKLYPTTSAEGRDVIRQEIRALREQWDELCDELAESQRRLDGNLMQWSSYDDNFHQFQKWLLDMEVKLKEDSELRATLPDKKAQLQNHRVVHQDILSRQHILENLADKARSLSQAAPSAKVNKFVGELQAKYAKICDKSKKVLDRFDGAVRDHQLYQDASHDFQDWLNTSRERLEACADRSGDKLSVQTKRERLKEFVDSIPEGEEKLSQAKSLATKTAANTSPAGRDVLQRETEHLQREWEDYLSWMRQTEQALEQALDQWGDFEVKFQECAEWLRHMEQQVRSHDLKSTVKEKQTQVEKFKRQREEILSHQPEVDRFTDDAQNLMHTSSDIRLSTQVSQLTNKYQSLLMLVKDLISKWEKMVHEHQAYESRLAEFQQWLAMAHEKLTDCQEPVGDQESMEGKRAIIQMLFSEKEHGLQRLNSAIEAGEKLNTDTANPGREKIRQELRTAKEDWDRLFTELSEAQRRLDSHLMQWSSFADSQEQLLRWMTETETALRADVDLKNTLQEKRLQLQNHRSLLQDIQSHQRLVDAVVEKAQGVLQTMSNSEVASFITDVSSRYEKLTTAAKALIAKSEDHVALHQHYQDSLQSAVDWMAQAKDKLTTCADTSGDRHTIETKLERLQELIDGLPEGLVKLKDCESSVGSAMDTTALKGRQAMKQELDVLKLDWEDYTVKLNSLKENLEQALHYWTIYEDKYEKMSAWIKTMEKQVKEFPLKTSLEEKQEQLKKYQDLVQDIRGHQREVDKFTDDAQTLQQLTGESRVGHFVGQVANRYQGLLTASKEIIKKCEQNVDDHRVYKEKAREFSLWLEKAKTKFADCSDVGGTRAELEERLEKVQDLLRERDAGFARWNSVVESGERLYPSTANEGREGIRQELRRLKLGLDTLFDELSAMQRKLEVALVQWTSFDDSYGQVEHWLREMEMQLEGPVPLRSTLEEKKAQLQNFKALHHDAVSYNRVIESINDKATNLAQTSSDSQLKDFISQTGSRYEKLCIVAKERVQQYEGFVADHQNYNDAYNSCVDWLNSIREKLSACSDVSGDRHAIQSRLDKIQPGIDLTVEGSLRSGRCFWDILATKMEGEPKVKNVMALAQKVLPNTAPQGKDIIMRDSEALRQDWEAFISALAKTKSDLESCMGQWEEFETWVEKCSGWLKDTENRMREIDLKGTQHEKQTQLDRLKALQEEIVAHQGDLDALSDSAQDLMRLSTDTRVVSQASQLATKYQTANVNIKELCRRWEQYVLDHQAYAHSFDQCKNWLTSMREKVATVVDTSGDRNTVQDRLAKVRELLSEKDEGLHMLQIALDNLQIVLPNTSVTGRDNLRRAMQTLQQEYDTLSADLNEAKTRLEGCLAQWTVYDDSIEQLQRWLSDLEVQVANESQLQNTLQEKKLLLERVKVLQLNISSQQSTIDNLNDKALNLKQTSKDVNLSHQIKQVVSRYEQLGTTAKELLQTAEKNLKDHQVYRDSYLDTSDWLTAIVDKLNVCSDLRGDRSAIEAQLHKVQTISATVDVGKKKLETTLAKGQMVIPETSSKGQELIREELTMLSNDFQTFQTDLADLITSLTKLREQWQQYEELYDEISQWMKDMEVSMKADADLKANLEQKVAQLDRQQACHEEILNQQAMLDSLGEQAQVLLQSSTDSRVSTQLSQLGTRYTGLITLSKDLLKRFEQHMQDHQEFHALYNEAASWLEETRDKLSVCTDTSGDRFAIQSQIEKLQEFSVMKEEGQLKIHTATTWGEKTMSNTSVDGKEIIRQELDTLQQDWDSLITEVSDTKTALEACLVQWTDFSASHDQVLKWLKEVERKLRDTQPKPDLAEKKAELQRIKGIYQDIVSYEQMVESVTGKAQDLAQKSPASKSTTDTTGIASRYATLKEQAKELLAKNEQHVAHHQAFHDACGSFSSWLRTSVEKLATCSDTYGEYTAIEAKIERAKSLFANLTEGSQRLAQATKAGEATLASTSASGQTRIRQDIKSMNKDFEEFRSQLVAAQSELEICLSRWEEFEGSYAEFNNWLKDTEGELRADLELKSTVEEKKHQWEHFQLRLEEILSKQDALDRVREKATALLQTNADAKTSHAITQLTTRYHGIIALAKDIVNSLEQYYNNHRNYRSSHQAFQDWLKEAKHRIKAIHDDHGSRDDVSTRLGKLDEVQATMDEGHGLLRALMDSSEKTLPNTSQRGCHAIRTETDTAKKEYENLLTNLSQTKRSLENAASHWADFSRLNSQLSDWLSDVEAKLRGDPELKADLPEKRSSLEKYKALQADIAAHRELFEKLEEKAEHVKDPEPQTSVSDLRNRYQAAIAKCKDALAMADGRVSSHEEYRKAYIGCLDWLANTKHRLQRLSDCTGDKRMLQDRLDQLREFKADLHQGQEMVNKAGALGDRLCQTTAPRGQDVIRREVASLREDWAAFSTAVADVESNLESCIANWMELDGEHTGFIQWLEHMEGRIKTMAEPRADLHHKQAQLQDGEALYNEIVQNKAELDRVRDKGESVSQRSNDPRVSSSMMQLSSKYQGIASTAKSMVRKLRENLQEHRNYDDALTAASKWLAKVAERVQACSDTATDWHAIQEHIQDMKDITANMDEGLQKVNHVCDLAEKILPNTSGEGKRLVEKQVTELTNEWERLNDAIGECAAMLEGLQQRWHEYEEYYGSLVRWLADVENTLRTDPEPRAQLVEKKTQLDKYKMILADIDNHQRLVNELADRVANLEALCDNPDVANSLSDVKSRYNQAKKKAKETVESLQHAYEEHHSFHEAAQDCERWLLQTSHRLLAHNSLNVRSMELTQRQIEKHQALIEEIQDFRHTLDQLQQRGEELIKANARVPRLGQQIQSQLQNLEESYANLESTAHQIRESPGPTAEENKERLKEMLDKWESYRQLLERTEAYLQSDLPAWLSKADAEVPDTLDDAQRQREATQAMLEHLYGMRQEMTAAAHRCENLGSTESLDQLEAAIESPLSRQAERVQSHMQSSIGMVEKRLDRLRDIIRQWDGVERSRTELRQWLHSKQEEVSELEQRSTRLHPEAAQLDIQRIQAIREEVERRGPAVEEFMAQYRALTQHKPSLADPVIRALQDDWEELLGQVTNLLAEREAALAQARDLQDRNQTLDEDLDNYARELERIDRAEISMAEKGVQMKPSRRACRSTQTPRSPRRPLDPYDSDSDGYDGFGPGGGGGGGGRPSPGPGPGPGGARGGPGTPRSPKGKGFFPPSPRHPPSLLRRSYQSLNRSRRFDDHDPKKGAAAGLESESEESGYGETFGETMHASSFDTHLDEPSEWMGTVTMRGTLMTYEDSDQESASSYITGIFHPVDPEDLRDASSQTPGHARTQTDGARSRNMATQVARSIQTQTSDLPRSSAVQTSNTSLHSIGAQTKRSSGSRSDLLRSILMEVKDIKRQQGVDSDSVRDDTSEVSGGTIQKETLQELYNDVRTLRAAGARGNAATQTQSEQATQTSLRLFPEGDPARSARHGRLQDMIDEMRHMRGGERSTSALHTPTSHRATVESPFDTRGPSASLARSSPSRLDRMESPHPLSSAPAMAAASGPIPINGHAPYPPAFGASYVPPPAAYPYPPGYAYGPPPEGMAPMAGRRVTQEALDSISERLDRLRNYQVPMRRSMPVLPPPPPPPPPRTLPEPPRRYRVREFSRSYDDMDVLLEEERRSRSRRRRHDSRSVSARYHLDGLDDALMTSQELKRMSRKMKKTLRNELLKY